eukprot:283237-Hanusia_phi.AAC.4
MLPLVPGPGAQCQWPGAQSQCVMSCGVESSPTNSPPPRYASLASSCSEPGSEESSTHGTLSSECHGQRLGDLDLVNSTQRSFLTENKD